MADSNQYVTCKILVSQQLADDVAGMLAAEGFGVETQAAGPDQSELTLYAPNQKKEYKSKIESVLEVFGISSEFTMEEREGSDWVKEYQESLMPIPLGQKYVVLPHPDLEPPDAKRLAIHLVPGQAFGTGEHPTTQLCVEFLESLVTEGTEWLDLGAGSGILSVVASHEGAEVVAVEIDPEASAVAEQMLKKYPSPNSIQWFTGELEDVVPHSKTFDGIVANIASSFFLKHATVLSRRIREGGHLVCSGFLIEDQWDLEQALLPVGFRLLSKKAKAPWLSLTFNRVKP